MVVMKTFVPTAMARFFT